MRDPARAVAGLMRGGGSPAGLAAVAVPTTGGDAVFPRMRVSRPGLSLRRNISWAFLGNCALALTQWVLVVLLTKLGGVEMVGQYALASAVAVPVTVFANMNLRGILATDAHREYALRHFVALRYLTSVVAVVIVIAGASLSGASRASVTVIALVTIGQAATSMQDIYRGIMQRAERMDVVAVSSFLQAGTTLGIAWLVLRAVDSLTAVLGTIALSRLLVLSVYDRPIARALSAGALDAPRLSRAAGWEWSTLLRLARTALPVGIVMLMLSVNTNIPRYALVHSWSELELGYFATLMAIPVAGTVVVAAFGQSAAPRLGLYRQTDHRAFRLLLGGLSAVAIGLGAAGTAIAWEFGTSILTTMFRAEYAGREQAFVWVMGAGGATYLYSMLGYGVIALGRFWLQLAISIVVAATTAVLASWLVPSHGVVGAAWAVLGASVAGAMASIALVHVSLAAEARDA